MLQQTSNLSDGLSTSPLGPTTNKVIWKTKNKTTAQLINVEAFTTENEEAV